MNIELLLDSIVSPWAKWNVTVIMFLHTFHASILNLTENWAVVIPDTCVCPQDISMPSASIHFSNRHSTSVIAVKSSQSWLFNYITFILIMNTYPPLVFTDYHIFLRYGLIKLCFHEGPRINMKKTESLLLGKSTENIIPHRYGNLIKKEIKTLGIKNRKRSEKKTITKIYKELGDTFFH